jgi:UDP-N-acetylglucosamine 2-epimerase
VVRDVTERPEGIEEGAARLVGLDPVRIVAEVGRIIDEPRSDEPGSDQHGRDRAAVAANPYGDGQASDRIVAAIDGFFGSAAP